MQSIDVLRGQVHVRNPRGEKSESPVSRIGLDLRDHFSSPRVPVPYPLGILKEGTRSREFLGIELGPYSFQGVPKCRDPTLGGNPRSGEDGDAFGPP